MSADTTSASPRPLPLPALPLPALPLPGRQVFVHLPPTSSSA